ncbi:HAMP domain-containing sensor histidine kinase [Bosea sp. TND4EK4]|uniref:sensor histidine kinase n=1 Tax=Bosea sp. TND4EK4 TaxID=1907408 RepID=UPI0009554654|nr:HAMP domain-containing sensor histidine kinase [Bosea sp. TND4EK4]SIR50678.1 Signal transduction histidine kinase [Bosea sp. TND4EK4]
MKRRSRSIAASAAMLLGGLISALLFCLFMGFIAFYGDDGGVAQFDIASEIRRSIRKDASGKPSVTPTPALLTYQRQFPQLWYQISTPEGDVAYGEVPPRVLAGQTIRDVPAPRSAYRVNGKDLTLEASARAGDAPDILIELGGAVYSRTEVIFSLLREPDMTSTMLGAVLLIIILTTILVVPTLIVRPVRRAAAAAEEIGAKEGARLPVTEQPAELRPLALAFNRALDRIDAATAEQRRFLSNAAHELRTPLTRLRTRLERVQDQEIKAELVGELQSLSGTVTMLLQLARLTSQPTEMAPLDLVAIARTAAAREVPTALSAGIDLEFRGEGQVTVSGSAQAIGIGLSNLLRNAIQHGGAGGRVIVEVAPTGRVSVVDFGAGIGKAYDGRAIIEPFARGKQDGSGTGLGLAIVAQIAALHGASLALDETPGGGTTVSLTFPPMAAAV